ncbi:MAG: sulfotransferase [Hyphomonadaceae bacterium]
MTGSDAETLRLVREAMAAFTRGDAAAARRSAEAALARQSEEPNALQVLGLTALQTGDAGAARGFLERAAAAAPSHPAILNALGGALRQTGAVDEARHAFARAGQAGSAEAWRNLGNLEAAQDRIDAAIAAYERATQAAPHDAPALASLARLMERRHDVERARALAERALALNPASDIARLTLAELALRERAYSGVASLVGAVAERSPSPTNQALAWGLIGEAADKLGDAAAAFAGFSRANALLLAMHGALRDDVRAPYHPSNLSRLRAFAAGADASAWRAPAGASPAPVFLVGFPRSGTTLLDQILSGHPALAAMEERDVFAGIVADCFGERGPEALASAGEEEIAARRAAYWQGVEVAGAAPGARTLIDKLPLNLVFAPLIRRMFPDAKVILALRDPRDVILSCFQQRFGMNAAMVQLLELHSAALFYDAAMGLFALSQERLGLVAHAVRYEDVVADLEGQARALCAFIGAPFAPEMLAFQATARARDIRTPSAKQVIQPLYTGSIGRWRRYSGQLAPVLPLLAPWAARFGYPD